MPGPFGPGITLGGYWNLAKAWIPAHQATSQHIAGIYPFVADSGLGHRGPILGVDLNADALWHFSPWEAYVDATVRHLGGDLGGGLRDRLHDRQPGAGLEGEAEPLGGLAGLLAGGVGGGDERGPEALDVRGDVHVHHYDITVTSSQAFVDIR